MIGDRVEIIAVPATRGVNPFAIDTSVRRTVVDTVENDYRYELEEDPSDDDLEGQVFQAD